MAIPPGTVVVNPLEQLTLDQLRTRTSMKWTVYPVDVLPLWVAEMDVLLAPAVPAVMPTPTLWLASPRTAGGGMGSRSSGPRSSRT
jgi:hypothetical protein